MKLVKMKCENCGATLEVDKDQDKIKCKYCHSEILIDDEAAELRRIEEVKLQARKQNHEQTLKEKKDLEELNAVDNFKKSKFSKVILVFAVLCGIVTLASGFSIEGIISFIQTALFIGSWLLGMEIIKHPNKKMYLILALVGFVLIIPFFALGNKTTNYNYSTKCEKIELDDIYLKDKLANLDKPTGEIHNNTKDGLYITFCKIDKKSYEKFLDETTKKGFIVDAEDETTTYLAYDEEGYKIYLNWDEDDKELSIDLDTPIKMSEITWPTTGLATKVPQPSSTIGKISWDNTDTFGAYIGNTTKQDYENYVKACQDLGFVNDHSKSEKRYSATNNDNYEIVLEYHGNNTMYISVDAPEETEKKDNSKVKENNSNEVKSNNSSSNNNSNSNNSNSIRSDFKNAMDSYETFMDEYIAFMKKYNDNPSDTTLLKDYTSYLSKYNDMLDKFDKWEDEDLNDAETKYYLDVQTRVNKKLTDAAL